MLYYFFALLAASIILIVNNPRNENNRWAALFLSSASIGGLAESLHAMGLSGGAQAVQWLNHMITPYGVLVFCIVYSEQFPRARTRLYLKLLLLLPVVIMLAVTILSSEGSINYLLLLTWTAPYYLASCYLLIVSLWREDNARKRRNRFIVTVIIVPTVLAVLVLINVANVIAPDFEFFRYISLFIIYSLTIALLCTFAYGVLGVKLRFERDPLESTMKAVSSGTTLLNHSIKNEIGKIAISSENLKMALAETDTESLEHLRIISNASDHMLEMVTRIHSQMKHIVLVEKPCRLDLLMEQVLKQHQVLLGHAGVDVTAAYASHPVILIDSVHVSEAIGNLLMNALEAMPGGGAITVRLDAVKKGYHLTIQDTGKGISSDEVAHIFDPFYSTKNRSRNFGLGLSYVYNVMSKSGGSVEVTSRENAGTVMTLIFSGRKTV